MLHNGIQVRAVWHLFDGRGSAKVEIIYRISSAMSDTGVAWVLFSLLALMAMNRMFVAEIALVVRGLYSRSERIYSDTSWQSKLLAWVYRIGIVSLLACLILCHDYANFALDYLAVVGVVAGGLIVRYYLARFVGVVFLQSRQLEGVFDYRASIYNAVCALLWPVALLIRLFCNEWVMVVLCGLVAVVMLILLIWRGLQLYARSLLTIFYVLLYIICLEVFPLLGIFFVIKQKL